MIQEFWKAFFALFVIMDVIGNVPMFCVLSGRLKHKQRNAKINQAITAATVLILLFLFLGENILEFFGISISSFRIAGGLIVLIVGIQMVLGLRFKEARYAKYEFAVVPFATPFVAGPGVLTTTILLVHSLGIWITFLAAFLNLLIFWTALRISERLYKFFGRQGADIISRIMGLIITALAVEFIREGVLGIL
jgi:multiple antibiotic resistance protein